MQSVLASLFIELGLSMHSQVPAPDYYWRWDITETHNPYGVVAIGLEHDLSPRLSARVYIRHESAVPVNDYGVDSAGASITWRPFR